MTHPEIEATPPLSHVTTALDTLRADVRAVLGPMDHPTLPERRAATRRLRAFAGLVGTTAVAPAAAPAPTLRSTT